VERKSFGSCESESLPSVLDGVRQETGRSGVEMDRRQSIRREKSIFIV
jgi:hypothetical protein